jgi:hypothetical protein
MFCGFQLCDKDEIIDSCLTSIVVDNIRLCCSLFICMCVCRDDTIMMASVLTD